MASKHKVPTKTSQSNHWVNDIKPSITQETAHWFCFILLYWTFIFILYYIYFYFFIIYVLFDYNADITLLKLGWMMHYHQILVLFISLFISNFSHFLFLFISFKTGNLEKPKIFVCTLWHKLSDHTLVIWNKVTP